MCMIGDQEYFTPKTTEMLPAFKTVNRKLQNTNIKMFFFSVLGSIYRLVPFYFLPLLISGLNPRAGKHKDAYLT